MGFHLGGRNDEIAAVKQQPRRAHGVRREIPLIEYIEQIEGLFVQVEHFDAIFLGHFRVAVVGETLHGRPVGGRFGDDDVLVFANGLEELEDPLEALGGRRGQRRAGRAMPERDGRRSGSRTRRRWRWQSSRCPAAERQTTQCSEKRSASHRRRRDDVRRRCG